MTSPLDLFGKSQHQFGLRVHRIGVDQWDAKTPCEQWTVRDLVEHLVDEQRWVSPLMAGKSIDESATSVSAPPATDDPVARWDLAAGAARVAFGEPGALDRMVALSRGATVATAYLDEMIMDATVHAWDLGRAIGVTDPLPADLVEYVLGQVEAFGDLSATGMFASAVPTPVDAPPEDRLVALTGRHPS